MLLIVDINISNNHETVEMRKRSAIYLFYIVRLTAAISFSPVM